MQPSSATLDPSRVRTVCSARLEVRRCEQPRALDISGDSERSFTETLARSSLDRRTHEAITAPVFTEE
jgi:hypothetical protein